MDEAQIAERLKQNIPQEQPATEQPAPDPVADTGYVNDMPFDELTKYKLFETFMIQQPQWNSPEVNKKIELIYNWASGVSQSDDYLAIQSFLRTVEMQIGYGGLQSKLDKFYHYAKLDMQRRRIEQEMQYANS